MSIHIPTSSLRSHLSLSGSLKGSPLIPILSYQHISCQGNKAVILKHTLSAFTQSQIDYIGDPFQPMLLDERILSECAKSGETVSIEPGRINTVKYSPQDPGLYPKLPVGDSDPRPITNETLALLHMAKAFADTNDSQWSYIYSDNNKILARDNFGMFVATADIGGMILDRESAAIISRLNEPQHRVIGDWDVFYAQDSVIGFKRRIEAKMPDVTTALAKWDVRPTITLPVADLLAFCNLTMAANPNAKDWICTLRADDLGCLLEYEADGVSNVVTLDIQGSLPPFRFNASTLRRYLSVMTGDVQCCAVDNGLVMKGANWQAAIMGTR